jgi:hypothetical protein
MTDVGRPGQALVKDGHHEQILSITPPRRPRDLPRGPRVTDGIKQLFGAVLALAAAYARIVPGLRRPGAFSA